MIILKSIVLYRSACAVDIVINACLFSNTSPSETSTKLRKSTRFVSEMLQFVRQDFNDLIEFVFEDDESSLFNAPIRPSFATSIVFCAWSSPT